jgi:hypothetical protein
MNWTSRDWSEADPFSRLTFQRRESWYQMINDDKTILVPGHLHWLKSFDAPAIR